MVWWKSALYDTCSIITLDKMLLDRKTIGRHFPKRIRALNESFDKDQMHEGTVERMRDRVTIQPLPTSLELAAILSSAGLPKALAMVDTLVFATAVKNKLGVVTSDRQLGRALRDVGVNVGLCPET